MNELIWGSMQQSEVDSFHLRMSTQFIMDRTTCLLYFVSLHILKKCAWTINYTPNKGHVGEIQLF